MTDLTDLIAGHRPYGLDCKCGTPINSDTGWARHLADTISERSTVTARPVHCPGSAQPPAAILGRYNNFGRCTGCDQIYRLTRAGLTRRHPPQAKDATHP